MFFHLHSLVPFNVLRMSLVDHLHITRTRVSRSSTAPHLICLVPFPYADAEQV